MRIYHGSAFIIENPDFQKGKAYNDYGRGFYCTEDMDLAREWAVDIHRDGYVNIYDLSCADLNTLYLNSSDYCILHWISLLLQNRRFDLETPLSREAFRYLKDNFTPDLTNVDIIKGYRADDSYFSYAQDFINGVISISQLKEAMYLGNLGEQVFLRSEKAFQNIEYIGCEGVASSIWYQKKLKRDQTARLFYHNMNKEAYVKGELYMTRIIDEEVQANDPRLQ